MYEPGDYKVVISLFFFLYLCGTLCSVICYFIFSPTVDKYSCGCYIRVTDSTATLDSWSKSESGVVPSQITRAIADAKMHESQVDRSFFFVFCFNTAQCHACRSFLLRTRLTAKAGRRRSEKPSEAARSDPAGRAEQAPTNLGWVVTSAGSLAVSHGTARQAVAATRAGHD